MMDRVAAIRARIDEIQGRFGIPSSSRASTPASTRTEGFARAMREAAPPLQATDTSPLKPFSPTGPAGAETFDPIIASAASKHGVDAGLVRAVIRAESGFDSSAVSPAGAQGLMQLMPATARGLGVSDPFDPVQNIDGGTRYLRHLLDKFGDPKLAIAAYNAGPGSVERYNGVPPFRETQAYVERVTSYWGGPTETGR